MDNTTSADWYRGICITPMSAPIPDGPRWTWEHPDYDGAPDSGDDRCGHARTLTECRQQIDEMLHDEHRP